MSGDFTRFIFDPDRQYIQTLMQQGRVLLDTDWNEQGTIRRYHHEKTAAAVIGGAGVPKTGGGFAIAVAGGGGNLAISPGAMYLDGLLVENRASAPVLLTDQPYLKVRSGNLSGFDLPTASGRYVVYLEVWERHVTELQDERLLEPALGGVDTTTRLQLVWQVRLTRDPVANNATCADLGANWTPPEAASTGTLTADTDPTQATNNPCVLPPSAGYRGLENALYRVEVHRGGARANARWKWSSVSLATTITVSGQVLTARELGRDEVATFAPGQRIEILDERTELSQRRGTLLLVEDTNPDEREIIIDASTAVPAVDTSRPVIVRRWDNPAASPDDGLPMNATPMPLEAGVIVTFSNGVYREGDYWMIPARTALNGSGGHLDWPRTGTVPNALAPQGPNRRFVPLALVDFTAPGTFALPAGADCRAPFPPLTALTASDVSFEPAVCNFQNIDNVQDAINQICRTLNGGGCSFIVEPESDLEALVNQVQNEQDALFCFSVGAFEIRQPVLIRGKGNIVFSGGGAGTVISARQSECVFRFENCASATVRNMNVRSGQAGAGTAADTHLLGTLTFLDCPSVIVENVGARCAAGTTRSASCIAVRNAAAESDAVRAAPEGPQKVAALEAERLAALAARTTIAQIRNCMLAAGDAQVGLLMTNVGTSYVMENVIRVVPRAKDFQNLVANTASRAALRKSLIRNMQVTTNSSAVPNTNATMQVGNLFVHFQTHPSLIQNRTTHAWSALAARLATAAATPHQVRAYINGLADQALGHQRTLDNASFSAFAGVLGRLQAATPAIASQGIACGGRIAEEVRIDNNVIQGVLQGIHIGLSHPSAQRTEPDQAGTVHVTANTILTRVGSTAVRARHAIFVGSCRSLKIDGNNMDVDRPAGSNQPVEGIRLFGNIGRRMVVTENHMQRFNTGIVAAPLMVPADESRVNLWLITENIAETATTVVAVSQFILDAENRLKRTIIRRPNNFT